MSHAHEPWHVKGPRQQDGADDYAIISGNQIIAEVFGRASVSHFQPSAETARRIVACVNACKGEDLAYMEFIVSEGKTLRGIHDETLALKEQYQRALCDVERECDRLRAERDELLSLIKHLLDVYERGTIGMIENELNTLYSIIAKAEASTTKTELPAGLTEADLIGGES